MPLLRCKRLRKPRRVQDLRPLLRRNLPQIAEGPPHHPPPVGRHLVPVLERIPHILLLLGRQALEHLIPLHQAFPLLRRPRIQTPQPVQHPLLLIRRKPIESWLPAQQIFLLLRRQVLMLVQPFRQMLLPRPLPTIHARPYRCGIPAERRPRHGASRCLPRAVPFSVFFLIIRRLTRLRLRRGGPHRSCPRGLHTLPAPPPRPRKPRRRPQNQQTQSRARQPGRDPAPRRQTALRLVPSSRDHLLASPTAERQIKSNTASGGLSFLLSHSLRPLSFSHSP